MTKFNRFLSQFNEEDFETNHAGITGQNMSSDDIDRKLLQARINQQKAKAARTLADRNVVFKVEAYEHGAHSSMMHQWVATMKEAKHLAKSWTKSEGYFFEEISIVKYRRPQSWPRSYGYKDIIPVATLKKTIVHTQEIENGPIQSEIKWSWE